MKVNINFREWNEARIYNSRLQRQRYQRIEGAVYHSDWHERRSSCRFFCKVCGEFIWIFVYRSHDWLQRVFAAENRRPHLFQSLPADVLGPFWWGWLTGLSASLLPPRNVWFFYHNGNSHSNCLDHINFSLKEKGPIIHPVNLFMHTKIGTDGQYL